MRRLRTVDARKVVDDARLEVDAAWAVLAEATGALAQAEAHLEWTTIRSPIDGVALEELEDPCELVSPQNVVAEIAPEANRQKRMLEVTVQIRNPDWFLTPELSAPILTIKGANCKMGEKKACFYSTCMVLLFHVLRFHQKVPPHRQGSRRRT